MSITQFKDTLNTPLPDSSPVAVPLGAPIAVASTLSVERNDGV
ncbi:cupin, partial [Pseudomonas sp. Env-33]